MVDVAQFRQDFPEFSDTTKYPDAVVQFWLTVSVSLVNPCRWGVLTDQGIELCTAHHLVLAARDEQAVAVGGIPGQMTGPLSSKSVDKVSAGYDTGAATLDGAGFWALSSYGIRYLTLARMFGAGGIQL
ncbi:DUF4054 domain-containing protein [Cupriavidus gilardii]|uniref:DUF4054 domain-containing protein n=1 Tax=Cupriavidus gilardii TaxID=82541 RepID=A0ABY4VNL7_9BURK|nr:DUF4054 domain-containing protein [Cupriavidus gilardii]USE78842.1 DUF4054 domain-containing protein [Cupriavidus gilardii]